MVEDVHGNNIKYSYDNYSLSGQTGNYENLNEGKIFNIKEIFYTGYNENNGIYSVEFLTDNTAIRSNPIINAKNGLKQIDVYLLKQINIKNNHELIRNYKFNYSTGRFNKTLLESVAEFDKNGNEFYKHKFEYYDDLIQQSEQDITLFEKSKSITLPSLSDPAPSFSLGVGLLGASRLNTTQTIEAGWEVSPAIGFEVKIRNISQDPNKTFMFNLPFGASYPRSRGIISMADIDGNGLEDIIYKHANGLSYRPCYFDMNSNEILYGSTKAINGIDSFYRSKGTTQNKIFQSWAINYTIFGHPLKPKINLGSRRFISKNFTDIYFTDGNGDGLIDIVKNDQVVFNEGLFNNDSNVFSTSSENTPNMLITASKNILPEVPDLDPIDDESAYEVVRVWVAPKDGTIKITDMLEMIGQDNNSKAKYAIETSKNTINNGIPFRLYYKELDIYNPNHTVSITNYNGNNPLLGSNNSEILNVVKNQRIYFRLNYLNKEDGTLVNSNPMIQYLNISSSFLLDENLVNHQDNSYSNAYLLNDNQPYYIPASGMVKFEWDPIIINSVSDDVTYKITQVNEDNNNETETVIYKKTLYASTNSNNVEEVNAQYNEVGNSVSIPFHVSVCPASREKPACKVNFKFEVYSDSNQKWNEIQWKPKMSFTPDVITDSIFAFETYPVAYHSVYKSTFTKKMMPEFGWKIPKKNILMVYGIKPKTAINIGESVNGVFYMIVKRNGLLVGKTQISVVNGDVYSDNINNPIIFQPAIDINNLVDQFEYTVGFYTEEKENSNVIEAYINATNNQPAYVFWDNNVPENSQNNLSLTIDNCYNSLGRFGSMYKEWGQFFYNDHFDNSTTIPSDIKGKLLNVYHIDRTDNIDPSTLPNFSECNTVATENTLEDYENCVSSSISTSENLENVNPENISEVTTNPMFNLINIVFLSANAIRNYQNQIEVEKWKGLFETQFSSPTKFKSGNFTGSEWDTVFPDEDMSQDTVIQANLETGMPAITKIHRSVSVSKHKSFSILIESLNSNFTKSESRYSLEIQNFMDINGDLYPEIITSDNVLFTNKRGGFTNMLSHNYGYINSSENFAKRAATNGKGIALGREKIGAEGKKTDRGNVFSEINVSPQLSINYFNNNKDNLFWLDVNGDGLLDQIKEENNEVKFNLNKGNLITSDFKNFSLLRGRETRPELVSLSLNAGLNLNNLFQDLPLQVNISGGYSNQGNVTKTAFQDLNGDGLVDLLLVNNGEGRYYVNTGNGFSNQSSKLNYRVESEIEFVRDNNNSSVSLGAEISKFFRIYSWPPILRVLHIKAGGSISGNANLSLSHANKSFKDFNGDGFVDYIERDGNNLNVYYSRIKRTNKLKMVTNPLGGTFTVDYKVQPVTFDNPHPKWAMSSIEVSDNYDNVNDGEDTYKKHFEYKDGKYDRREREFYGYKEVRVLDYTTNDAGNEEVYRTNVTKYNNSSYFLNGLATENYTLKGNDENQKYNRTENTYKVYALNSANDEIQLGNVQLDTYDVGGKEGRRSAAVLLTKTRSEVYELNPTPGLVTEIEFTYDSKGRIEEYVNKGDVNNTTDDYKSFIKYHEIPSLNIISIPQSIVVTVLDTNTVKRIRKTEIDENGNITGVSAINGDESADTKMKYDEFGNLTSIKYPNNTNGQAMINTYMYDTTYYKYVEKVTDNAFGYESTTLYNSDFDKPIEVKDIAGNKSKYFYDDFGRTTRIVAPKEDNNSDLDYTIKFEYFPYANLLPADAGATTTNFMPVAVTQHFDVQHPDNPIETYTFVDGLGRPAQVKKDIEINTNDTTSPRYIEALTISGKTKVDKYARTIEAFQPWWEEKNPSSKFIINEQPVDTSSKVIYDELDRVITSIDEEGNTATVQFAIAEDVNGINCLKTTSDVDQNGGQHVISETYHDASGKLLSTKNVGGTTGSIWTKFNYNAIGELLTYTDAENLTTEYTYDMLGRKVEVIHPDNGTTRYKYDNVNLIAVQTQNLINEDKFIKYIYNCNRLKSVVFPETPSGENLSNVHYKYGNTGNETGRVIAISDATGVQIFKYGVMGETIEIDRTIVAPNLPTRNFITKFHYDSFNRIQKLIYPDGEKVGYWYNTGGNLNKMTTQLNRQEYEYVKQIDYDYFEQKTYMKYGNNTETFYNYSPELRRLQKLNVTTADGQNMFNNVYSFDKVGNITKITNDASYNTTNYLGGTYNHNYAYDNLNRLSTAKGFFSGLKNNSEYGLSMAYNDTHGIIQKNQSHTTQGYLPVYENSYANDYKYMENTHKTIAVVNAENGMVDDFKYDANGNMKVNWNSNNFREMFWDESNRLRVVYDQNSYQMQHYIYDAVGERILKASSKIENVYENGQVDANTSTMGLYTTYVSPYMVVDANQRYSKHYFNGSQRVASKMGEKDARMFDTNKQYFKQSNSKAAENSSSTDFDTLKTNQITDFSYYLSKSTDNSTAKNVKVKYTEYKKVDTNTETTSAKTADNNSAYAARQYADIYYYHSDHLGTGTFLSDFDGNPYQFFLNLPFGETMAEQHSYSGDYTNRYKFNGKELDEETGFYYYGARYYNPKFSIWLSTDPLAEKFPSHSPYSFCFNNPLRFVDPDGRAPSDWIKNNKTGKIEWRNEVTSIANTPKGYGWIGKDDNSIILNLFGTNSSSDYSTNIGSIGFEDFDNPYSAKGAASQTMSTYTTLYANLSANVTTKYNDDGTVNGKTFNGVDINVSVTGMPSVSGSDIKLRNVETTLNGNEMKSPESTGQTQLIQGGGIGSVPTLTFSSFWNAKSIQSNFNKSFSLDFSFRGQYYNKNSPLSYPGLLGAAIGAPNRTNVSTSINFKNEPRILTEIKN
jgi:RHS repeat-associated protein